MSFEPVAYRPEHRAGCLAMFDANCPDFFAPNERADFVTFLDEEGEGYRVCLDEAGQVAAGFGVYGRGESGRVSLNWILVDPTRQGGGWGRGIMDRTLELARAARAGTIDIAASHRSAPFFARFGAVETGRIADGWGPGMHRVDMELAV